MVAVVCTALAVAAGGLYAYDRAHANEIAKGVRVAGVEVGGMSPAQARARLERVILDPLRRPVVLRRGERRWKLSAREARVAADIDGAVRDALERSRSGDVIGRSVRGILGRPLDAELRPAVTYSDAAIVRLLDRVRGSVDRPARDARVRFSAAGVTRTDGRTGVSVRTAALHRRIRAAIVSPTGTRRLTVRTRTVEPKVSMGDLADRYPAAIVVDRGAFQLRFYKRLKLTRTYPIAVGQVGLETPAGLYNIQNKAVNPAWHVPNSDWAGALAGRVIAGDDPSNPIKARWMGIYDGAGIHGTDAVGSLGTAASHGCIRMAIPDVIGLYAQVPVGAPVYIA